MTRETPTYGTDPTVPRQPNTPGKGQADRADDQESRGLTDRAGELAGQARETASQVTSQVSGQAQQTAQTQLATRKDQATSGLESVANALQQVGTQLRQNDQQQIGHYADLAAGQVSRVAGHLRQRNVNQLVDEVQDLARQQPTLFLGGAFVLGLIGARFLKASGREARTGSTDTAWRGRETPSYGYGYGGLGYGSRPGERTSTAPTARQGTDYGVYDPGSEGMDVREVPQ